MYQGDPRKYQARPRAVPSPAATTSVLRAPLHRRPSRPLAVPVACPGGEPGSTSAVRGITVRGNSPVNHARQVAEQVCGNNPALIVVGRVKIMHWMGERCLRPVVHDDKQEWEPGGERHP